MKDERVARVQKAGLPFVLIGRTIDRPSCDWVDVDGIVTINEASLPGLMPALVDQGRSVPEDVSVCGIAMEAVATHTTPSLSSCDNPVVTMAKTAVDTLVARLQGREERTQILLATPAHRPRVDVGPPSPHRVDH